ncbi:hypothetical protein D3C71_973540 [compost metagenome]
MQANACRKTFRRLRKDRRRPRVQAIGVGQVDRFGEQRFALLLRNAGTRIAEAQAQHGLGTRHQTIVRCQQAEGLATDQQHQGQQAAGMQGYIVGIELDQRLSGLDTLALLDQGAEPLTRQVHGVQTNVQQHLYAAVIGDADRMTTVLKVADHAGQRRAKCLRGRIDAQAVADHPAGEHRIRHVIKWHQHPGQRRQQLQWLGYGHDFTCGFVL